MTRGREVGRGSRFGWILTVWSAERSRQGEIRRMDEQARTELEKVTNAKYRRRATIQGIGVRNFHVFTN
jgi:hypothetical protein